jgi:hypothetical protein
VEAGNLRFGSGYGYFGLGLQLGVGPLLAALDPTGSNAEKLFDDDGERESH